MSHNSSAVSTCSPLKTAARPRPLRLASAGSWDAAKLDEDKLARKIGSSKAARMLGLTEEQVLPTTPLICTGIPVQQVCF